MWICLQWWRGCFLSLSFAIFFAGGLGWLRCVGVALFEMVDFGMVGPAELGMRRCGIRYLHLGSGKWGVFYEHAHCKNLVPRILLLLKIGKVDIKILRICGFGKRVETHRHDEENPMNNDTGHAVLRSGPHESHFSIATTSRFGLDLGPQDCPTLRKPRTIDSLHIQTSPARYAYSS